MMSIANRKLSIIVVLAAIVLLANVGVVTKWLQAIGIVHLAQLFCAKYVTGTALAVVVVVLLLVPATIVCTATTKRCFVCEATLRRRGKYCPDCGARV